VLKFGDKPAPAMAQIALRKTADQVKSLYPEAAQVLKDIPTWTTFVIQFAPYSKPSD